MADTDRLFPVGRYRLVAVSDAKAGVYNSQREGDWKASVLLFILGLALFWPGMMIRVGTEGSWTAGISTHGWGAILVSLAAVRVAALIVNGRWQTSISATVRAGAAFLAMTYWGQIMYVLVLGSIAMGRPSVIAILVTWLWASEARAVIRSLDDASAIREAVKQSKASNGRA